MIFNNIVYYYYNFLEGQKYFCKTSYISKHKQCNIKYMAHTVLHKILNTFFYQMKCI